MIQSAPRRRAGALPTQLTSLVGRRRELAEVKRLLAVSRLVTLTGVGGVGKTRLAVQAATDLQGAFPDGVCLVELSALRDGSLLAHLIAAALELQDQTTRPVEAVLADYLADARLLLVLDTCEVCGAACADLAAALLAVAPQLRILATSRHTLGVMGEHVLVVPPLPPPDPGGSRSAVLGNDAVALFVERAAEVAPGFALTDGNKSTVATLCCRLDGIPLAIELAAARLRDLPADQLLARLDNRFEVLDAAGHAAQERHRTMRVAIGWSHELCEPAERLLWARLSVFPADFDLDAVVAVCAGDQLPAGLLVDLVAQLVDKSIVLTAAGPSGVRFRMLDTVRDYGMEWLQALGEPAVLRRRHRDHYLRRAERAEATWLGPDQLRTFTRTEIEHANLRAALDFSLTTPGEVTTGLRLAGTLWFYWASCGYLSEGRRWLDLALALSPEPGEARTRALWAAGAIAVAQGDHDHATAVLEECRAAAHRAGDKRMQAYAILSLATVAQWREDLAAATRLFEESLAYFDAVGDVNTTVYMARIQLAFVTALRGDLAGAEVTCEEARAACAASGEQWVLGYALYVAAFLAWARDRPALAAAHAREGLRINHRFHNLTGTAMTLELLALIAAPDSSPDSSGERTAVLHGAAQPVWRALGKHLFGSASLIAQHDRCAASARESFGHGAYETAYRRGTALGLDEAVAYALDTR